MESLAVTVELSSVRKTFGPTIALDDCSLTARAGEVHAIVGGNGSGKSTLAKVMAGVLIPDSGQVSVLGEAPTTPVEARRLGVVNVFQEVLVADGCSVLDNLYMGSDGLFTAALNREEKNRRAADLMHRLVGYEIDLAEQAGPLPLSLKEWIVIGRALLGEPKVLVLDESSAALDYDATERLFAHLRELKAKGTTILIVTHRVAELLRIADKATILRDGRDVGCLDRDEITEERILELIAGPQAFSAHEGATPAAPTAERPVLRVEKGRVAPEGALVDFVLRPGEIVGVTGLDGQGQQRFVRALAGVAPLISGTALRFEGRGEHRISDLHTARRHGISYVSGDRKKEGTFPNLSIFENLALPVYADHRAGGALNIVDRAKLSPIFKWETDKLQVRMEHRDDAITSLSGGNQQKVLIARAFAERPDILVLNVPARGIDVGAKLDLYRNLREFAAKGGAVVFLSSEIEEFLDLCTRVEVFRGGTITADFQPPFDANEILNATFGRRGPVLEAVTEMETRPELRPAFDGGRPVQRTVPLASKVPGVIRDLPAASLQLHAPDIPAGGLIPEHFAEDSLISPRLEWPAAPEGTHSFALAVTDPDLPEEFNFPRAFAHWLVHSIPAETRDLAEGASTSTMPLGAVELNSDYVTFGIPGYGPGYAGPWPPDREHRYVFTLYALKTPTLDLAPDADLPAFSATVLPVAIETATFTARYGPARKPLPGG